MAGFFDPLPPDDGSDPMEGTPYRVIAKLGEGGMGEVFEAEHKPLRKPVVVKLLRRELMCDVRFADRLRVEAQALAAIRSPYVVNVTDLGETPSGRPYLVMERLVGHTLREELNVRGFVPVLEALWLTRQVLLGLAAVHRAGLVHRDIKPENIFVCTTDDASGLVVKILDLGVAKVLHPGSKRSVPAPQYPTEQGSLVGTPRHVSPEQARFQKIDARTDIYAVGLLLYTLVSGKEAFPHQDMLKLLNAHIAEMPPLLSEVASQPIEIELNCAVIKALSKKPEHRFQSAEAFADELLRISHLVSKSSESKRANPGPVSPSPHSPFPLSSSASSLIPHPSSLLPPIPHSPPSDEPTVVHGIRRVLAEHERALVKLPPNLATPTAAQQQLRYFLVLMVASTFIFCLMAALLLRYLGRL